MSLSDIISILSVIIAIVSTVVAAVAIANTTQMQHRDVLMQNYEDMRNWFERTVLIMKELYIKHQTNLNKKELTNSLVQLSANIDLGRIYFKNQISGDYKINKPEVFRGRRVILLDVLVLYYNIFKENLQEENKDILWGLQRAFISEMIMYLDKNKFSKKYVKYDYIDENDIIEISNINNKQFRDILLSQDLIKAVKEQTITIPKTKKSKKSK